MQHTELSQHIADFAKIKDSPIYATLSQYISRDEEILQDAAEIPLKRSPRTILLAAVHDVLLSGVTHPLADFYPTLGGTKKLNSENKTELWENFRDFYFLHRAKIKKLLSNNTQTNEAKRSVALVLAFNKIQEKILNTSNLALIEVGTSAGLLLNFNKYGYDFGNFKINPSDSELVLKTNLIGESPLKTSYTFPNIKEKIGIDINILDLENEDVYRWLQALAWPEFPERLENLKIARKIFLDNKKNIHLLCGKFEDYLAEILKISSACDTLCIICTWVLYQFSKEEKQKFFDQISEIATQKKVFFIYDDWTVDMVRSSNFIYLREYCENGTHQDFPICEIQHHGNWVKALAQ